jgi:ribosomal protein S18 acetylase RimI-like enzyme
MMFLLGTSRLLRRLHRNSWGEYNLIHLERIYVLKSHHGKGLGKALLAKVEERSRELKKSGGWLGVWDENSAAVDFYNRNGFKKMGSQNWDFEYKGNLYRDNDDIMVKLNQTN